MYVRSRIDQFGMLMVLKFVVSILYIYIYIYYNSLSTVGQGRAPAQTRNMYSCKCLTENSYKLDGLQCTSR